MKKQSKFLFRKKVIDLIMRLGATHTDRGIYGYQIITDCGILLVSPEDDWIATCFVEPKRIPLHLQINRYSGKWNFHPGKPDQSWVDFFEQQLATIGVRENMV